MIAPERGGAGQADPAWLETFARDNLLDAPVQPQLDNIVELAAAICATRIATVTLADGNRQWFNARISVPFREAPAAITSCALAIVTEQALLIPDAAADSRFQQQADASPIGFYAGVPLTDASGRTLGTLAVMDFEPRQINSAQLTALQVLAGQALRQIEAMRKSPPPRRAQMQGERSESRTGIAQQGFEDKIARDWDTAADAVLVIDDSGSIVYANPRSRQVFGYAPEELQGQDLGLLEPARNVPGMNVDGARCVLDRGGESLLEWRFRNIDCRCKDGHAEPMEVAFSEIRNRGRRRFIGFFRSIPEHQRVVAGQHQLIVTLEESRARLAEAQAVAKIGSWDTNLRDLTLVWSDETYRIFEVPKQEFAGTYHGFLELVHPDDRAAVDAAFTASLAEDSPVEHELEHRRIAGGRIKLVQERWRNFFDAKGRPVRSVGTVQDITERKAEQERILRLSRMHEVLSGVNQLIVRATDRNELFEGCCRIAASHGQFGAAWIDVYDADSRRIYPVALDGEDAMYVVPRSRTADPDAAGGLGLAARAILAGRTMLSNGLGNGVLTRQRAIERGYRSGISLPLSENGRIIGALSLLSKEPDFFDADEVRLLDELAADISLALDRLAKLDQIRYLAHYDVLTGLPNRALFIERLGPVLEQAQHQGIGAVVLVDLQRLRDINNGFGRHSGDELLRLLAQRLRDELGEKSPLGRVAGDQFLFAVGALADSKELAHRVQQVLESCFRQPFQLGELELRVNAKAGVATFPQDGDDPETLLRNAEAALKKAKTDPSRFLFYAPRMNAQVTATLLLESRLRNALENGQFVLHYQPKFNRATGAISGVEGLIRWNDPETGLVPPLEIIPLLEASGLILEVGEWVLNEAISDYRRWRELVPNPPRVAVNVSSLQLHQVDFVDVVRRGLAGAGRDDHGLDLEITESVLMSEVEDNIEKLDQIRRMGVRVAIDDFGTGYSSLLYLARLPLDTLKVDRSFITSMAGQEGDRAIVSTIVSLAHQLGLSVVAEGVDAQEQVVLLDEMSCDELQGFLFSKPLPASAIDQMLVQGRLPFSMN